MTEIERLRKLREQVERVIEAEPELDGPMPDNVRRALADSPESMLRATVRVTKDNIAASALGIIDAAIADAEREQAGASPAGHPTCWSRIAAVINRFNDDDSVASAGALVEMLAEEFYPESFADYEPVQPEPVSQGAGYPSEPSEHDSPSSTVLSDGRGMTPAGSPSGERENETGHIDAGALGRRELWPNMRDVPEDVQRELMRVASAVGSIEVLWLAEVYRAGRRDAGCLFREEKARADAAEASRKSDHAVLLDAWRDRGERVSGKEGSSTIQRVLVGIHELRERAEKAEEDLAAIDAVIARRPALDKPTRRENIEHAINTAKRADQAEAEITKLREEREALERLAVIDEWGTVVVGHGFVSSDNARYIAAANPEIVATVASGLRGHVGLLCEANARAEAAEAKVTALEAEVARLRDALAPFAGLVHSDGVEAPYPEEWWRPKLTAAHEAMKGQP